MGFIKYAGNAVADSDRGRGARASLKGTNKRFYWSKRREARFLDHLAASGDVAAAAAAVNATPARLHQLRRADPGFAAAWREALLAGYEILEARLVGLALRGRDGAIDTELALKLLGRREPGTARAKSGVQVRRVSEAALEKALGERLDALARPDADLSSTRDSEATPAHGADEDDRAPGA